MNKSTCFSRSRNPTPPPHGTLDEKYTTKTFLLAGGFPTLFVEQNVYGWPLAGSSGKKPKNTMHVISFVHAFSKSVYLRLEGGGERSKGVMIIGACSTKKKK